VHASTLRVAAALAGVVFASSTLAAQAASRPTFGVSGGLAIPTGDFADGSKSGYDISVNLGFQPATLPVGLRVEGMYDRFDLKDDAGFKGHTNILALTGNAVLAAKPSTEGSIRPYAIGGLGVYNLKFSSDAFGDSDSQTKFGLNIGAGLELPLSGITTFAEVRYHHVFTDGGSLGMVPIVVGVKF
jgi:opacity protein-like surface antigen